MAKSALDISLIKEFQQKRIDSNYVFDLKMCNNNSYAVEAEILSNKAGLSGNNVIDGYSEVEIDGWLDDYPNEVGMMGIFYDPVKQKMIAVRYDSALPTEVTFYFYEIESDGTFGAPVGVNEGVNIYEGQSYDCYYNEFLDEYHIVGHSGNFQGWLIRVNSSFVKVGESTISSGGTVNHEAINSIPSNGYVYLLSSHFDDLYLYDVTTQTLINNVDFGTGLNVTGCIYVPSVNKFYVTGFGKVWTVDYTTFTKTEILSRDTSYGASDAALINGYVVTFGLTTDGYPILTKWDPETDSIVSERTLSKTYANQKIKYWTDDRNNLYLYTESEYNVYDFSGEWLSYYSINNRTPIPNGVGNLWLDGFKPSTPVDQKYNPITKQMFLSGEADGSGGTVWINTNNYKGGLSQLDLTTSACSYGMAVAEFNTEPILLNHISLFYKNGGSSYDNLLKYFYESSFGACERINFQPRKYISAKNGDKNIIDIDLRDNPLVIDVSHFFRLIIPANECITLILYYRQAEKKDILKNKLIL
jgi:hypothetical protein